MAILAGTERRPALVHSAAEARYHNRTTPPNGLSQLWPARRESRVWTTVRSACESCAHGSTERLRITVCLVMLVLCEMTAHCASILTHFALRRSEYVRFRAQKLFLFLPFSPSADPHCGYSVARFGSQLTRPLVQNW